MRVLLLDVWHDLREKRLWPVALFLLVALVALPLVLLARGDAAPGAPTPAPGLPGDDPRVTPARATDATAPGSALEVFSPSDPFARGRASAGGTSDGSRTTGADADVTGGDAPVADPPAARAPDPAPSSPSSSSPAPSASSPVPSTPSSPAPVPSTPTTPDPAPSTTRPAEPDPRRYTDTVDVTFGRRGVERRRREIARLEPLPASGEPVALFLGTTPSGFSAVFFLQPGLEVKGDGGCEPSRIRCSYLTLRPDRRHDQAFLEDEEGRKWSLRLDGLELVPLAELDDDPEDKRGAGASRAGRSGASPLGR
jgi:hypothetical protein